MVICYFRGCSHGIVYTNVKTVRPVKEANTWPCTWACLLYSKLSKIKKEHKTNLSFRRNNTEFNTGNEFVAYEISPNINLKCSFFLIDWNYHFTPKSQKDTTFLFKYMKYLCNMCWSQWRNRGDRRQSAPPPPRLLTRKFLLTYQGKRGKEKMENGAEKKENWKREGGIFAFHFSKPLKFVLGLPKWECSAGKKHFTLGKKSGKITLPPLKNIPLTPIVALLQR